MKQNVCVASGVAAGVIMGALTEEQGLWLAVGAALGLAVAALIGRRK